MRKEADRFSVDVEYFARYFFGHLLTSEVPKFHKEIYEILPKHQFVVIQAFRGAAKSTIGLIIYPIWFSLFKRTGDITLLSKSEDFVRNEIVRKIKKEFEQNEKMKLWFGDMSTDKWSESYFVLSNGIAFEAGGIGGQLRGGRRGLIALDDLEDEESAESEEQREKLRRRINKELIPKLVQGGQIIYMGTPVSRMCYIQQLIDIPENGWEKRIYPAYKDRVQEDSNELWPQLYNHSWLQDRKQKIGSNSFYSEYLCSPVAEETVPIKENMIRYWETMPDQYSCVIAVDPAYSEDHMADYKVASLVALDQNMNRYLMNYIRTHDPIGEFIDAVLNMYLLNKNALTALGVPSAGVEKSFFESFLKRCEERKIYPPVVELKNSFKSGNDVSIRNKKKRIIAALQPLFEHGKYYIRREHEEARDEILNIGNSRHDDVCLVAGTKIATKLGEKNIEDIVAGDIVITPQGYQKVTASLCTGYKKVINKFGLVATPNHKIFSSKYGIVSIDALCYNDVSRFNIKEILLWRYKKLLYSMEFNTDEWVARENIIFLSQIQIKDGKILKDFMSRFGNLIMGKKFRMAGTFITRTATLLIMIFQTLCVFHLGNIISSLKKSILILSKRILNGLDRLLQNGINLKKDVSGIGKMLLQAIRKSSLKNFSVIFAGNNLNPDIRIPCFAQMPVSRKTGECLNWITKIEPVLFAEKNFQLTDSQKQKHAVNPADIYLSNKSNLHKVYNITVENEGLYYANRVLVSNCDTLAYAENILQPTFFETEIKEFDYHQPVIVAGYGL